LNSNKGGLVLKRLASRIVCNAAIALSFLAATAHADMRAFNAAVKAGDYKTAAAEAKTTWPSWNKTDPDTAIVAREFGFASYVAGDYAAARDYGKFLKDQGASLAKPDDQPETSAVLLAAASYRLGATAETRQNLVVALKTRMAFDGLDNVSVLAVEALYRTDWASAAWSKVAESGTLATALLGRGGEQLAPRAMEARITAAAAGFLGGPDKDDYNAMVDAHDAVIDAIDAATDSKKRSAMTSLKYLTQAWANSIATYFDSSVQIGSNIPKNVKWRKLKDPKTPLFESGATEGAPCRGRIDAAGLSYPSSAAYKDMIGTVIMKYDFDQEGRVIASEILASAPAKHFAEAVLQASPGFRLVRIKEDPAGCGLAIRNRVITFAFRIL
jgi:hypothetical protein